MYGRPSTTTTCRTAVTPDAPPTRQQLGDAAVTWAAVSLADKLDTVVGMFYAGEKPTGSRDPFGLRRQAHGIFKILVDLADAHGSDGPADASSLCSPRRRRPSRRSTQWPAENRHAMDAFLLDRYRYVLEQRGFDVRNVRAVLQESGLREARSLRCAQAAGSTAGVHRSRRISRSWRSRSSA